MHTPFAVASLGTVFSIGSAVVSKDFSAGGTSVRYYFSADTVSAVLIPPGLFAVVGAEEPRSCSWGIDQFTTAVLTDRLARSAVALQTDLSAIGL